MARIDDGFKRACIYFFYDGQGIVDDYIPYLLDDLMKNVDELVVVCNGRLTDDGRNISKGQKQLLTIARAMLLDAHMLILDEATSNVDTRTELQIQEAMLELMKDKTCFVIAHRLSTIQNADCILVVKEGEVIEQGTHDELMEKRGFYRSLYDSQFAGKQI